MKFIHGLASPCCFQHSSKDLRCIVHVDDFLYFGPEQELRWVRKQMEQSFLVKIIGQLGGDPNDQLELRVLNRVRRWSGTGIFLEADPRHQEILVANELGKPVLTPSIKEQVLSLSAEQKLTDTEASVFRCSQEQLPGPCSCVHCLSSKRTLSPYVCA